MRNFKTLLALGTALTFISQPVLADEAADAADQGAETSNAPQDITVTARRTTERLQDVPVAVSVVSMEAMESRGSFSPVDIAQSAPGLNVTASVSNRNNLTYTIRGQGFSYGTVFPAVITYFNEVPISRLTQGQFFDLSNVQVLRGPQGVNFGRVTDGGNVMVTPQAPKNEFGGYVTAKAGDYSLRSVSGAINVPLVEDKVLLRLAFETTRRDGFTTNVYNGQKLDDQAYEGYRGSLTLRPFEGIENTTVVSYLRTHDNGTAVVFSGFNPAAAGLIPTIGQWSFLFGGGYGIDANGSVRPMAAGLTPLSPTAYAASMQAQLNAQNARGPRAISWVDPSYSERKNLYITNATTIELGENIELKNIFGYTREKEDEASNFAASNGAAILTCHSACPGTDILFTNARQISNELRLSGRAFDNRLNWAIGGYMDEQTNPGPEENATINVAILNRVTAKHLTTKSRAVYGSLEYALTDNLKINGGLRYTHDTFYSEQNTYLSPIDGGQTALYNLLTGPMSAALGMAQPLSAAAANAVVAATFAPIPHGKCVTYGAGSMLYSAGASPCVVREGKFNATTWTGGISYKTNSGQLFYAKISKGYRPGGVNNTAPQGVDPRYQPETDVSIEAGVKADFDLGGAFLRTNLALYTDRYKAIQKNVVLPGPVPLSLVQNVDDARIKGIEGEMTFIPVQGLRIEGNFAYTSAKFDPIAYNLNDPTVVAGLPCDPTKKTTVGFCSENRFNSVPEWQYALSLAYTLPLSEKIGEITLSGRLFHQSSLALTDTSMLNPQSIEPAKTTLDLNVDWKNVGGQPVDLGFFVTNVTNKLYRIGTNNLMQNSSVGVLGNIYAPPRMWGFSLKYRFGSDAQ